MWFLYIKKKKSNHNYVPELFYLTKLPNGRRMQLISTINNKRNQKFKAQLSFA